MPSRTRPIEKFANAVAQCSTQASAYGKCIVADYNHVHKDKCLAEFIRLKECYLVSNLAAIILILSPNLAVDGYEKVLISAGSEYHSFTIASIREPVGLYDFEFVPVRVEWGKAFF